MELFTPEIGLIFWLLIPFLVVFFILAKFAWPAILGGVAKRNQFIDESLLAAKQAIEELDKVKENSQKIIDEAKKEQASILSSAVKSRDEIVDAAKGKASDEANKILEDMRKQILKEKEDALREIRKDVALLSVDIAEKLIRKELTQDKEQADMIERLIDEINIPKS